MNNPAHIYERIGADRGRVVGPLGPNISERVDCPMLIRSVDPVVRTSALVSDGEHHADIAGDDVRDEAGSLAIGGPANPKVGVNTLDQDSRSRPPADPLERDVDHAEEDETQPVGSLLVPLCGS